MTSVLTELLHGAPAFTNVLHCVDVPDETARRRPTPLPHSIWQLVWHMNYWMAHELARIAGRPRPYPDRAALSWPSEPEPGPGGWRETQERFRALLDELRALAEDAAARGRTIPSLDPREGTRDFTVEEILWQTVVHNSYHLGQVAQVRRALGAWPPKEGSDTW